MSQWWIEFHGKCQVDADTQEEAIAKLRSLNPHDGRVYDDWLEVDIIADMSDE